jgi:hypothetical protein
MGLNAFQDIQKIYDLDTSFGKNFPFLNAFTKWIFKMRLKCVFKCIYEMRF